MKQILLVTLSILVTYNCSSQFIPWSWDSTQTEINQQILRWDNGTTKLENKIENGRLIRYQYYENETLQLRAEINKRVGADTITIYDPDTYEATIKALFTYYEVPYGTYTEYYKNGSLKASGKILNNLKQGRWKEYWDNGKLKLVSTYDDNGLLSGKYKEYYEDGSLKAKGKYKVKTRIESQRCYDPNTYLEYDCDIETQVETKVGKWKYFDILGRRVLK